MFSGFINYINELTETDEICSNGLLSDDFSCSDSVWYGSSDNDCVNEIMSSDGTFGEFETCVNNTWNSLTDTAQESISVILDCLQQLDETDETYVPANDTWNGNETETSDTGGNDGDSDTATAMIVSGFVPTLCILVILYSAVIGH